MPIMTPVETLHCDQAIFTSVRGSMGEGYRIIAASRGLRSEEKQAITRLSPSHEALCWQPGGAAESSPYAVAFYPLPAGRLCVAYSCYAGVEHTARGGYRVYTHNVIFDEKDFPLCGYNPFHVVRAMTVKGLTIPNLTPDSVLQEVLLPINTNIAPRTASFAATLDSPCRRYVLQQLFEERALIVPVQDGWLESTEVLLMGLPGPMRVKLSFGAGLRFSLGRCHRLHLFCDEKGTARSRIAGHPVEYVDGTLNPPDVSVSQWLAFVDGHWRRTEFAVLTRRTSRPFTDLSYTARERIGTLYIAIDAIPQSSSLTLLSLAADQFRVRTAGVEDEIRRELLAETHRTLLKRLIQMSWHDAQPLWLRLVAFWRQTEAAFAQPLIVAALRSLVREDPLTAAEAAVDVGSSLPAGVEPARHEQLIDEVLSCLPAHLPADSDPERLAKLCSRCQSIRPAHPALQRFVIHSLSSPAAGILSS